MDIQTTDAIKFATSFADASPKEFREVAFQSALQYYLNHHQKQDRESFGKIKPKITDVQYSEDNITKILQSNYDWSVTNIPKLQSLGQSLALLKLAREEFGTTMLSVNDIQKILLEKFRIKKSINTISMSLMKVIGKYVDRIKYESGFCYKITSTGESQLEQLELKIGDNDD